MSDYTITTETTRVIVLRLTEGQARKIVEGYFHDFQNELSAILGEISKLDAPAAAPRKHGPALTIKRQARTPKEKPAEQPAPKAAAPSKGSASTQVRCAQCGKTVAARGLKVHLRKCPKSAPATAVAAASSD